MPPPRPTRRSAARALAAAGLALGVLCPAGCAVRGQSSAERPPSAPAVSSPSPAPSLCPGETPSPRSSLPPDPAATEGGPPDYASNHGFQDPIPLVGAHRCEGLAKAARVEEALRGVGTDQGVPLDAVTDRLAALGYPPSRVDAEQSGAGVYFIVNALPDLCLEGEAGPRHVTAEAFAGYPDTVDSCERPVGGH